MMSSALEEALRAAGPLAWTKLGDRALCDACLGRLVGKAGHGLTNPERGRAIRERFEIPSAGPCWVCGGLLEEVDKFADLSAAKLDPWEFATFLVGSKVDPEVLAREESLWAELGTAHAEAIKSELNREIGKRLEKRFQRPAEFARPDVVAIVDTAFDSVAVTVNPLFVYGRYRKLVRGIPQTRWPCRRCQGKGCEHCGGKGKMYETSVEEIVAAPVMAQTGGSGHALHGMGREDVDALMLGRGRPFIVEIKEPAHRTVDLAAVEAAVDRTRQVEVTDLRRTTGEEVVALKEDRARKTYRVLVRLAGPVADGKLKTAVSSLVGRPIAQRTPVRVSHRRADRTRERLVTAIEVSRSEGPTVELRVTAEAGTYVKELVHGDGGRTTPSLAEALGVACEVVELDVLDIQDRG
jgi:tRNA pseudouridine synthase 10